MADKSTSIESLKEKVGRFIMERDWEQFHNPKNLSMSISIESAELMELFQWKDNEEIEAIVGDTEALQEIKDELADIMIYSLSLANRTGIDLSKAVLGKLKKNSKKYPIKKARGSAVKYGDL